VDWIFVDDVVEGLLRLAETPGVEGRTVDIGSGALVGILCELSTSTVMPLFATEPDAVHERVAACRRRGDVRAAGLETEVDSAPRPACGNERTACRHGRDGAPIGARPVSFRAPRRHGRAW
jgi:hypothetical protein